MADLDYEETVTTRTAGPWSFTGWMAAGETIKQHFDAIPLFNRTVKSGKRYNVKITVELLEIQDA